MGWETRATGGRYYTRSRRIDGRVAREYVGCGRKGELAAMADAERRAARAADRVAIRAERERVRTIDRAITDLHRSVDQVTRGALLAAGFERHKRQWRRRHDDPCESGHRGPSGTRAVQG